MDTNSVIVVDPEIMHGTPVFRGTRVPVKTLFDYLSCGDSLDEFLKDFPGVHREQTAVVLEAAGEMMEALRDRLGRREKPRRRIVLPVGGEGGLQPGVDLDHNAAVRDLLDNLPNDHL